MFAQLKSNDMAAIAVVVIVVAVALYLLFSVVGLVFNDIGSIFLVALIGLLASIVGFYLAGPRAK